MDREDIEHIITGLKFASNDAHRRGNVYRDTWGWTDLGTMDGVREACQAYAEAEAVFAESRVYQYIADLLKTSITVEATDGNA